MEPLLASTCVLPVKVSSDWTNSPQLCLSSPEKKLVHIPIFKKSFFFWPNRQIKMWPTHFVHLHCTLNSRHTVTAWMWDQWMVQEITCASSKLVWRAGLDQQLVAIFPLNTFQTWLLVSICCCYFCSMAIVRKTCWQQKTKPCLCQQVKKAVSCWRKHAHTHSQCWRRSETTSNARWHLWGNNNPPLPLERTRKCGRTRSTLWQTVSPLSSSAPPPISSTSLPYHMFTLRKYHWMRWTVTSAKCTAQICLWLNWKFCWKPIILSL